MSLPEAIGIGLGAAALLLTFVLEWLRLPRIQIKAERWGPAGKHDWTFAVVHVRNKPLPRWLPFTRASADGCRAMIEFRRGGDKDLYIREVPGRWSGTPQPVREEHVQPPEELKSLLPEGAVLAVTKFDAQLVPQTLTFDLPAASRWEEIAIAVLHRDGEAHAFGAESYAFGPLWKNPDWKLERGVYDVAVRLEASGVSKTKHFKLDNLAADFARFKTAPA